MSIQDLDIEFELIAKNGGGDFDGRKDPVLVDKSEKRLGAKFPPSYKKFLNVLGCADIKRLEFLVLSMMILKTLVSLTQYG